MILSTAFAPVLSYNHPQNPGLVPLPLRPLRAKFIILSFRHHHHLLVRNPLYVCRTFRTSDLWPCILPDFLLPTSILLYTVALVDMRYILVLVQAEPSLSLFLPSLLSTCNHSTHWGTLGSFCDDRLTKQPD